MLQAAAAAFAVVRLLQLHLGRRFPFLCSYLVVTALTSAFLSVVDEHSSQYFVTFMVYEPLAWLAEALAVFEMFALIFRDYPGLRTVGRWALYWALGASFGVSLFIARLVGRDLPQGGSLNSLWLSYDVAFDRSINFTLTVVIVILMWFLSRYPLHLDRNTYVASGFFSAMFLAQAAVKLIDSVSPQLFARYADYPEVGFAALCFVGWGAMIRPATAPVTVRTHVNEPRETELLQQLAYLNGILSRSVRG
jgi:hypothetical protein